jgi:hypothetical protein
VAELRRQTLSRAVNLADGRVAIMRLCHRRGRAWGVDQRVVRRIVFKKPNGEVACVIPWCSSGRKMADLW